MIRSTFSCMMRLQSDSNVSQLVLTRARVPQEFEKFVQSMCKLNGNTPISAEMVHRIRCLSRIPFKAIVTTNYNSVFCGLADNVEPALHNGFVNPCKMWESILRGSSGEHVLLDDQEELVHGAAHGDQDSAENKSLLDDVEECAEVSEDMTLKAALEKYKFRCPILKIHGCVEYPNSIVLSRRGYKRLQYETPGFKMFLTSAMATNTMLYIGFSFTDDYLNEFRAEVCGQALELRLEFSNSCITGFENAATLAATAHAVQPRVRRSESHK